MNTRTTAITATLGLAATTMVASTFVGGASAAPRSDVPVAILPTTEAPPGPTTMPSPPTTLPPLPTDELDTTTLGDAAPRPVRVLDTRLPPQPDRGGDEDDEDAPSPEGRGGDGTDRDRGEPTPIDPDEHRPVDAAEATLMAAIDVDFAPELVYYAACGNVPYNLQPGIIQLADMTGDGSADDRLSIRKDGSGDGAQYWLHLELSSGQRSEAWIPSVSGQGVGVWDTVQVDGPNETLHPRPAAEEVLVNYGNGPGAVYLKMYGVDERGCVNEYLQYPPPSGVLLSNQDHYRAGYECRPGGRFMRIGATLNPDQSTWEYVEREYVRTGVTTGEFQIAGIPDPAIPTANLPTIGSQC